MSKLLGINTVLVASILVLSSLVAATPATAATRIVIINGDDPNEGFNDPTPAAPVGGNPGTTKGQQRLIAFQYAADLWGLMLDSTVEIRVLADFAPLGANVLGSAGTTAIFSDFTGVSPAFPGAAFADTWYHSALADKRSGADLLELFGFPHEADIAATFSSDFDFYLGLDNQHGAQIDLVTVILHELGHGLGFSNFVNEATGANIGGQTDIFSQYTLDTTNSTIWSNFTTNAARAASARRVDKIVWNGQNVTTGVPFVLQFGRPEINVNAPAAIAGSARVGTAGFGPTLAAPGITRDVVVTLDPADPAGPSTTDGCSPLTNAAAVAGKIALIDRGACTFVVKTKNAQNAGAIAVIIANNVAADPPPGLGGVDPTITIPAVMITQSLGASIKAQLVIPTTVNVNVGLDVTQRAGADPTGLAQVFATDPVQPGSSISHYDLIAFKNQLMEPAINPDLTHEVIPPYDLTLPLMRDVGWYPDGNLDGAEDTTFSFGRCTTKEEDALLSNGARLSDQARVWYRDCAASARNHGQFVSCVAHTTNAAKEAGLITGSQKGAVQQCAAQAVP